MGIKLCILALGKQGFEAYVVGGCVRDSLLWLTPKDWDICTADTPLYRLLDMYTADALAHTVGMQQSRVDKCVEIRKNC